jgi:predicted PurR-regulated permease PerM
MVLPIVRGTGTAIAASDQAHNVAGRSMSSVGTTSRSRHAPDAVATPAAQPDHVDSVSGANHAARRRVNHMALWVGGLFALATIAFLYFGEPFLLPVVVAVLIALALRPVVRFIAALRTPEWLAALIVVAIGASTLGVGAYKLSEPAAAWMQRSPSIYKDIDRLIRRLRTPIDAIGTIAQTAEKAAQGGNAKKPKPAATQPIDTSGLSKVLLLGTWTVAWGIVKLAAGIVLLYFLLAAGDHFLLQLVRAIPRLRDRVTAVSIARSIEQGIGRYLLTLSAINLGIGVAVAGTAWLVGLPNPPLWGALAAVLHFIPYLGAAISMVILTAVGLVTIPDIERAFIVPLVYLGIVFVESQVVQPLVFERRHALNPVVIFIALLFWTWIWGIPGALVAVPMLIVAKITCDHIEALEPIAAVLGSIERKQSEVADERG